MGEKLVLIDGHSILHRAFFGIPDLTNSEGLHTNAVYGFLNILFKILEEEKPNYLTVAFDLSAPTFRHKMFGEYKGTRKPMAEELRQQVPVMKEMLTAMGIPVVTKEGYEADDILGTIAKRSEAKGMEVSIVSGDRDLLQLATEHIKIRIPKTKKTGTEIEDYYEKDVKEKYQVSPIEFIDVKALMGDASDNIPGVPSIGEKTATALIVQYHSIENAYEHIDEVKPPRAAKNLKEHYELAQLCKTLATIETNAEIEYEIETARLEQISDLYTEEAYLLCKKLELKHFLGRFEVMAPKNQAATFFQCVTEKKEAKEIFAKVQGKPCAFQIIPFEEKNGNVEESGQLSLFAIPQTNSFFGMAISFGEKDTYFFQSNETLTSEVLVSFLTESKASEYITLHLKPQLKLLNMIEKKEKGSLSLSNLFDGVIAAYLLNPLKSEYPYEDLAKDYAGLMIASRADLMGKMGIETAFVQKKTEALNYVCYQAYTALKTKSVMEAQLKETEMYALFMDIEMPLVFTLADMEDKGIILDAEALKEYGEKLSVRIKELEVQIYEQSGETFNINSPKQLGVILFEKLKLPYGKKTKTGYSTAAEVLEKLAAEHKIVADILEYRQLTKLKSTYADGLVQFISEEDGRVHTNFKQTITATGRLSSTDPNLQNIPIRIELGRLIRKAFLPKDSYVFMDADYSQIELRVLAHMSGDEKLIEAYKQAQDIHRITASQVFHIPFEEVTDLQRRNAKAVNFGIVYGISSFGLSQDLSISKKEAAEYMERYFETYPKMKPFLDKLVADAKGKGYVTTMFGRRRPIPELASSNFMQRSFGERVAMNAPIQGTSADIIKIAMNRVHDALLEQGLKSRLIVTVHDELLVETAEDEIEKVKEILINGMKEAAKLAVTLEVEAHIGKNWYEAK